jgi:signal peptidase I
MNKNYSYKKCQKVLTYTYNLYKRKKKRLDKKTQEQYQDFLLALQTAIIKQDEVSANRLTHLLEELNKNHLKRSLFDKLIDFSFSIIVALIIAVIVRQMWFEPHSIPTGSMRPTLKEGDYLIVSKTAFGINTLTRTSHLYFDPALVKRGSIVTFSVENLDVADPNTVYFYLFPGKKQYIKRLIAKPGDTIYFYGGQLYAIDAQGTEITELRHASWAEHMEHIPFIHSEGKAIPSNEELHGIYSTLISYQMNEPVAKIELNVEGKLKGEMLKKEFNDYYDLWGFKNFATARILSREEVEKYTDETIAKTEKANYYLVLTHHPSLKSPSIVKDDFGRLRPSFRYETSVIPLSNNKLEQIFHHIYTSRFIVKNGYAMKYSMNRQATDFAIKMAGIPDGCYEFIDGIAYKVLFHGITIKLPSDHPLCIFNPERVKLFYNLGLDFDSRFITHKKQQFILPNRYAYFKNKNLYLLGYPIFKKDSAELVNFLNREYQKQASSSFPYLAFEDLGAPLKKNGEIDADFIRKYGITVPDKMYLMLGDNHACSADSRDFGFVPQDNIRGTASFLIWPPQERFGLFPQPYRTLLTLPRVIVWSTAILCLGFYAIYKRKKNRKTLTF